MRELKNHSLIKRINRAKVLNAIRMHSPSARAQLAEITGLDRKSITNFVSEFTREGLIEEAGKEEKALGRPLTMLRFKRSYVAGIHIAPDHVQGVIMDLYGKTAGDSRREFPIYSSRETILAAAAGVYRELCEKYGKPLGVGLGIPGILDAETGVVRGSVNLPSLDGANLRKFCAEFISEPLFFEDSSRTKALAEKWLGAGRNHDDFVCIDWDIGIGAGIISGRNLFKGAGHYAGEIGHVMIESGGTKCRCGNCGCLEAYISEKVLLEQLNATLDTPVKSLSELKELNPDTEKVLKSAGSRLGTGLAALVNLLNPTVIIINGGPVKYFPGVVLPAVREAIKQHCLKESYEVTTVAASKLEEAGALGAATLVLANIFEVAGFYNI